MSILGEKMAEHADIQSRDFRMGIEEPNPLQQAFDNYKEMKRALAHAEHEATELRIENRSLVAEVGMLREQMARCDKDRTRLQAVASTFGGQARALSAIFNDIMSLAIKNGVAATETPDRITEQAHEEEANEVREILERTVPSHEVDDEVERPTTMPPYNKMT